MLKTFVFYEDKKAWLEEQNLLLHDICAILDEDSQTIYIWKGPESSEKKLNDSRALLKSVLSGFPSEFVDKIKTEILDKSAPPKIQKKIDSMLEAIRKAEQEETVKYSHLQTIKISFVLLLISVILPIMGFLNIFAALAWPAVGDAAEVMAERYNVWLFISMLMVIITLVAGIANLIMSFYENDYIVSIISLATVIGCIGLLIYYNQGIYIFLFEEASTAETYLIPYSELLWFVFLSFVGFGIMIALNVYLLIDFFRRYREYIFLS